MRIIRFFYAVLRDSVAGNLPMRAMGLVYVTILSIVPLIAISFSVLKGFGFHRRLEPLLYNLLQPLGEKGVELTDRVIGFVDNIQGNVLAGIGLILLFVTSISMAQKVEDSFNFVWRVQRSRSLARRLTDYLSVILVGPVVMVTAMALIGSVTSNELVREVSDIQPIGATLVLIGRIAPHFLVALGFTFIYWFLPNTRVNFSAAFVGGLTGGILWATTGRLFATFVASSLRTIDIYASFAVVIVALIWLYVCWLILLIGAQVAFYFQNPEHMRLGYQPITLGSRQREQMALTLMSDVAAAFRDGAPQPTLASVAHGMRLPGLLLVPIVRRLEAANLVTCDENDALMPRRDPRNIRLIDVMAAVREPQSIDVYRDASWPASISELAVELSGAVAGVLGDRTLYDLVDERQSAGD